jgi:hypothetical protein
MEIILSMVVMSQAHPLPFKRPHATIKLAIASTIRIILKIFSSFLYQKPTIELISLRIPYVLLYNRRTFLAKLKRYVKLEMLCKFIKN